MPIRLSGMSSGLDTDKIVQELVAAYSTKKDNYVKKQTKLEWTMDAWKEVNTKVYGFYTSTLSSMRYSSSYNLRTATITDSKVAQVSASAGAVTSTQSLAVKQLAASGYFTGGEVASDSGSKVTNSTKLSELGITSGTVMLGDKEIELSEDMSLAKLTARFKEAGVTASFDDATGRFFVSSTTSGAAKEFSITAGDVAGFEALNKLGLVSFTDVNGEDTAELKRYREYAAADFDATAEADERYDKAMWTVESYTSTLTAEVKKANDSIKNLTDSNEKLQKQLDELKADDYEAKAKIQKQIDDNNTKLAEQQAIVNEKQPLLADEALLQSKIDDLNAAIRADIEADINDEVNIARDIVSRYDGGSIGNSSDSARITAKDAIIKLNGATFTSNTNSFSINGLNINATSTTVTTGVDENGNVVENDNAVTVNTAVDTEGIYNKIKSLFSGYNEMISHIDGLYYAESSDGYEPLTDEEKEAMTDKQIEDWEEKIKESLLRRDTTLGSLTSSLRTELTSFSMTIGGKNYSLASLGIATGNYFTTTKGDRSVMHIDGDKDDSVTSGNADKLMAAISENPDAVIEYFQKLSQNMYNTLGKKMSSSSLSSAFTIYNDKQMSSQYSEYQSKIDDWEERLDKYEESYYQKFSAMETALSKLQSQQTALSSMLGG